MRQRLRSCEQAVRRLATTLLIAAGTTIGASGIALGAETAPAKTVAAFYDWYLAYHGRVSKKLPEGRRFFDDVLFGELEDTYFKGDEYMGDMLVSRCSRGHAPPNCKDGIRYDPFSNDSSPARSYVIGVTYASSDTIVVKVTLRLNHSGTVSHVSAVLRSTGSRFVIANLLFEPRGYYYAGPIVDLAKLLSAYNC